MLFNPDKKIDFAAIGRLCIDLNANEINRPMEETRTFTKYVGGSPANICIGMSRLGLKTAFVGKVADDFLGPVIRDSHKAQTLSYIETGEKGGALLVRDGRKDSATAGDGYFVGPTIFDNVDCDMKIWQDEIFAPVLSVMHADTLGEAIEIATLIIG